MSAASGRLCLRPRQVIQAVLVASVAVACMPTSVSAALIEMDLHCPLGPVGGTFGDGQTLSGVGTSFSADPVVFGVGDTLVVDISITG